ncbi:hypothetical protein E1264_40145 [Actinomadura sp. KC216]|nr:hypothetical protein E1264_40145 [Actinomadura sp. KC216]
MTSKDPLGVDPFTSADPAMRIENLYRTHRATHHCISLYGPTLWTEEQHFSGRLTARRASPR